MTNKRFKWLLIVASLTTIIVAAIWKYPDIVKVHQNRDMKLGKYVYVDPRSIIHVSRKCPKLNYKGFKSRRVMTEDIRFTVVNSPHEDFTFCPHCVSDKDYEELSRQIYAKDKQDKLKYRKKAKPTNRPRTPLDTPLDGY